MGYDGTLKFDTSIDSSGFQSGINKISSIAGTALKATTAIIGGAAATVVGIGTAAIKVGAEFDSAMSEVEAISGATGNELQQLRDKAIEMGDKTKFSATESAEAFQYMAMAGWKTGDMLDGIEGIMNLAAASGEDLATTSDIVTDALTAFGLSAADSTHFADILAQASSNANTNVSLMGETFKYVAPVAGALGFSAEDTATAIGLMANAGIKGSQAGTSLRSIMSRLASPTDAVASAMDELGISITNSDGSMKSLDEIIGDLRSSFSGLSEAEKTQMAATIGGQEAMSGLLAIVNASESDYNKLKNAIYDCDGAAEQMADTMNDNLSGQLTILKGQLETFGIQLSSDVQEPMKDVVIEAQSMVSALKDAYSESGLGGMISATGEVLTDVVTQVADAAPELIHVAEDLVHSFIDAIMDNGEKIATSGATLVSELAISVLNCVGDIYSSGIVLFRQFLEGIAANASEIGSSAADMISKIASAFIENLPLIVQAGKDIVAGFFDGMSEEFPGISALLEGFFESFIDTAERAAGGIADLLSEIFNAVNNADPATMEAIGKAIGTIAAGMIALNVAKTAAGHVKNVAIAIDYTAGAANKAITAIPGFISKFGTLSGAASKFKSILTNAFPGITSLIKTVVPALKSFVSTFGTAIAGVGALVGGAVLAVTSFVDMFKNGFNIVKDILMGIGLAIAAVGAVILGAPVAVAAAVAGIVFAVANVALVIKEHWNEIVIFFKEIPEKIGEVVDSIGAFFSGLGEKISTGLSSAVTGIIEWGSQLYENASTAASNAVNAVVDFFTDLPNKISSALSHVIETLAGWGMNLINWATTNIPLFIENIVTFFGQLPEKIMYWLGYAIGTVIKWGIQLYTLVTTEVPLIIQSVVDFFAQLPGKIWTWLVDTVNKIIQWGINLKSTADTYVTNTINSVVNFFSQLPGKIWTWLVNTVTKVTQWGTNLLSAASTAASNTINKVVNWFSQLPGKVWTWLVNTVTKVTQWGTNLLSAAGTAASNAVNKVVDWFSKLPDKVWKWLSSTVSKVTQFGSDMAKKASSAASGFCSKLVSGLSGLPGQMRTIGSNIVTGIWKGISGGWSWLVNKVKSLAKSLLQGAKDALGISSPSKLFAQEVGQWIPPGIGLGVDSSMPDLESQIGADLDKLTQKMQAAVVAETGNITIKSKVKARHVADTEYPVGGNTYVEEKFEQHNTYNTPVTTPSEVSKSQREAARKLLGGVK